MIRTLVVDDVLPNVKLLEAKLKNRKTKRVSTGTEKLLYTGRMPAFPGMGYPLVPGYESVGRVVEAGPHSGLRVGQGVYVPGARCYGDEVREKLRKTIGPFPEKTPLNPRITGTLAKDGYRVEKLVYESRPDFYVTAALFVPEDLEEPAPAILFASGHTADAFRRARRTPRRSAPSPRGEPPRRHRRQQTASPSPTGRTYVSNSGSSATRS